MEVAELVKREIVRMKHSGVEVISIRLHIMKLPDEVRRSMGGKIRDSLQFILACIEEKRLEDAKDELFSLKELLRRFGL